MTREEERQQAAEEYDDSLYREDCFIAGSKWADEHPREGLVDIDKVCEWLDKHSWDYLRGDMLADKRMIEDLRKAMEV